MPSPTPLQRLFLAFYAFFAVLFRGQVASAVQRLRAERRAARAAAALGSGRPADASPDAPPAAATSPAAPPPSAAPARPPVPGPGPGDGDGARTALYLLGVLQREGRLLDFVAEDVAAYPDATVGAAARTVHEGCRRALRDLLRLEPVLREPEGAVVTVERGFDAGAIRLTGAVVGAPPFRGALRHHGWRASEVKLRAPAGGVDPTILAPAEVEL
jgi:hypothetical protein